MTDRTIRAPSQLDALTFDARGLLPVVVQDAGTGAVLMVAWGNRESLERTLESDFMHFWSRSRGRLWKKGETSGHVQRVVSLHADCDADTILARVEPAGPACHTGETTCFGADAEPGDVIGELWSILDSRARDAPEGSYTARLLANDNLRLKKIGEETAELLTALARGEPRAVEEAADLVYHVMVALRGAGRSWPEVTAELRRRRTAARERGSDPRAGAS